jgi:hypothetical protein
MPPFTPATPGWMWAPVKAVPAGNPVTDTVTSSVAAVIVPAESLVTLNVRFAVPDPLASAPVIAGALRSLAAGPP